MRICIIREHLSRLGTALIRFDRRSRYGHQTRNIPAPKGSGRLRFPFSPGRLRRSRHKRPGRAISGDGLLAIRRNPPHLVVAVIKRIASRRCKTCCLRVGIKVNLPLLLALGGIILSCIVRIERGIAQAGDLQQLRINRAG